MHQVLSILTLMSATVIVAETTLVAWRFQGAWWLIPIPALLGFAMFALNVFGVNSDTAVLDWARTAVRVVFDNFAAAAVVCTACFAIAAVGAQLLVNVWEQPGEQATLNLVIYGNKADELLTTGTAFAKDIVSKQQHKAPIADGVAKFRFPLGAYISPWVEVDWSGSHQRAYLPAFELNRSTLARPVMLRDLPRDAWEPIGNAVRIEAGLIPLSPAPIALSRTVGDATRARLYAPWGVPAAETLIFKPHMAVGYHTSTKVPRWTAHRVAAGGQLDRRRLQFTSDPALEAQEQADMADYRASGFDRGHLTSPKDLAAYGTALLQDTYYFTAVTPQTPLANRRTWFAVERATRELAAKGADVYVISGTAFLDSRGRMATQAVSIGAKRVAVPTHFFRIVVRADEDGPRAWAFLVANEGAESAGAKAGGNFGELDLADMQVSVPRLEQATGLTFFPDAERIELVKLKAPDLSPFPRPALR